MAEARETTKYPNAFVCDNSGKFLRAFKFGDAINKLIIDSKDRIWVGYFDEGVFGDFELSRSGLNRFDKDGKLEYSFKCDGLFIDDCYNLNIDANDNAIIAPYSKPEIAIIEGDKARIIGGNYIGDVPFGLFVNDDYIAKIGVGFDKNDPKSELEKLDYLSIDLTNNSINEGPLFDKLDENRFEIYASCITIINRKNEYTKLVQVFDENDEILSLRNCNCYHDCALISANGKIYSLQLQEIIDAIGI